MQTELNTVLSLIATTIFADKRVYSAEIEMFVKSVKTLEIVNRLDPDVTEARLLMWYELNKETIRKNLNPCNFEAWYTDLLERLVDVPEKKSILDAMHAISGSDDEVHVSEVALITLAERYWKISSPAYG